MCFVCSSGACPGRMHPLQCDAGLDPSTADSVTTQVEMEVVGMQAVVIRPEHAIEDLACGGVSFREKPAFGRGLAPVAGHRHFATVRKDVSGDVDRIRRGVLAALAVRFGIDVATREGTQLLDTD